MDTNLSTKVGVTVRGHDFEDSVVNSQKRDIEGTTAKVVHQDVLLLALLIQAVRDRGGRRLVDDTEDVQAGDLSGILRRLTLGVVEVGWDRDDGRLDFVAQVRLSGFFHLGQDHRGDLLRGKFLLLAVGDHADVRTAVLVDDLERPQLHISLNVLVLEVTTD
ncbi:hypothetical protein PBRA_004332 [Plasmodiophora brassicae]|uniref:Uncharacterized protein n=1 Tax=Plasmodiophora brassicae TaxID=37360 RepID=A0A0G4IK60_PLABS|nr:hypothetical protein PBRA_004332 [Plasmodiophora brassicae]